MRVPVLLAGGSGSRLWPLSRELYPKQLLALRGDATLLQETARRLAPAERAIAVCNEAHRFLVAEQLRDQLEPATVLLEPVARSTAPAAAAAAFLAREHGDDPVLVVAPADHVIEDVEGFRAALERAEEAAHEGHLCLLGVVPGGPETGYGYIGSEERGTGPRPVTEFVEKPDRASAEGLIASGGYLWNAGIFVFRASRYLEELERHAPAIAEACRRAVDAAERERDFVRLHPEHFASSPSDSIDYAVMERTDAAVVVPIDVGWSDVGTWDALHTASPGDADGNVQTGDVLAIECRDSLLHSNGRLVAALGLRDHVVVETADAVLVAPRDRAQDVKRLVEVLRRDGRSEGSQHRRVRRPWGSFESLDTGEGFQVKRLTVFPGAVLSLQRHAQRAEHWVVVAGRARVTLDDAVVELGERESIDIPVGAVHRVENPGTTPLHIIEVQSGAYLGEDDIVRLEDRYGRTGRSD